TSPIWIADEGKTVTPSPGRVGEVEGGGFEPTAVVSPALPLRPSSNRTDGFPIFGSPSPVRFSPLGREPKPGLMRITSWRRISLRSHRPPSSPDTRTSILPLLHPHYRSFFATTQDSDFSDDA